MRCKYELRNGTGSAEKAIAGRSADDENEDNEESTDLG